MSTAPGTVTIRSVQELVDTGFDELVCTIDNSRPAVPHLPRLIAVEASATATLGPPSARDWAGPRSSAVDDEPGLLLLPPIVSPTVGRGAVRRAYTGSKTSRGARAVHAPHAGLPWLPRSHGPMATAWLACSLQRPLLRVPALHPKRPSACTVCAPQGPRERSAPADSRSFSRSLSWGSSALGMTGPLNRSLPSASMRQSPHPHHQRSQYNTMRISIQFGGSSSGLPTVTASGGTSAGSGYSYSYSTGSSSGRGSSGGGGGRSSSAGNYEALLALDGDNVRRAVRPEVVRVLPMVSERTGAEAGLHTRTYAARAACPLPLVHARPRLAAVVRAVVRQVPLHTCRATGPHPACV